MFINTVIWFNNHHHHHHSLVNFNTTLPSPNLVDYKRTCLVEISTTHLIGITTHYSTLIYPTNVNTILLQTYMYQTSHITNTNENNHHTPKYVHHTTSQPNDPYIYPNRTKLSPFTSYNYPPPFSVRTPIQYILQGTVYTDQHHLDDESTYQDLVPSRLYLSCSRQLSTIATESPLHSISTLKLPSKPHTRTHIIKYPLTPTLVKNKITAGTYIYHPTPRYGSIVKEGRFG